MQIAGPQNPQQAAGAVAAPGHGAAEALQGLVQFRSAVRIHENESNRRHLRSATNCNVHPALQQRNLPLTQPRWPCPGHGIYRLMVYWRVRDRDKIDNVILGHLSLHRRSCVHIILARRKDCEASPRWLNRTALRQKQCLSTRLDIVEIDDECKHSLLPPPLLEISIVNKSPPLPFLFPPACACARGCGCASPPPTRAKEEESSSYLIPRVRVKAVVIGTGQVAFDPESFIRERARKQPNLPSFRV